MWRAEKVAEVMPWAPAAGCVGRLEPRCRCLEGLEWLPGQEVQPSFQAPAVVEEEAEGRTDNISSLLAAITSPFK